MQHSEKHGTVLGQSLTTSELILELQKHIALPIRRGANGFNATRKITAIFLSMLCSPRFVGGVRTWLLETVPQCLSRDPRSCRFEPGGKLRLMLGNWIIGNCRRQ